MLARVSSGEVTQEQGYLQNGQTRRTKIILHFNVHEVRFWDIDSFVHLHVAVLRFWEDQVGDRRDIRIVLWTRYANRVYKLRVRPVSPLTFP